MLSLNDLLPSFSDAEVGQNSGRYRAALSCRARQAGRLVQNGITIWQHLHIRCACCRSVTHQNIITIHG
ncbi:hypothetical protein EHS86_01110 [Erwinia amylovora]|uniref:Uncharacterized protein n=3 Tax=Erwinia amylovora TaxID=552 RepID=A0A831A2I7_ERWAM|nr:hypothetical protein AD997_07870 [Erwinia amylovora]CBA20509.1 hypothetical protein predicted by Glimmer/Critica [Erwinia amylovora CFBP1430]CBX80422.1 hypothetical protein predicted by Glimmer/Critica [Erwinia amylovora ATCC BAA-2158]CCO78412.1 hypothetical protein BN432_1609 [Erwinia amylovora Ea356]CCO85996.1 hypothetical protein BN434_1603 [Erwinia amylovora CFBP 2585]CCO89786.1 hypothetical protein BN435_1609 [Erwinia amylovora 01SFR-BO]CCO93537.1 hypothetical protein BN437_1602 [Erwi